MSSEEQALLRLTNAERAKKELRSLKPNATLFRVARLHSRTMARTGEFSHVINDQTPVDRATKAGYRHRWIGENIAWGMNQDLQETFRGWMRSKPHRENILRPDYREIGLGIATAADGKKYFTEVFGTPAED
jgi:uncharacterized protein YkwD